jgi:predicted alpha/beta hydrolase
MTNRDYAQEVRWLDEEFDAQMRQWKYQTSILFVLALVAATLSVIFAMNDQDLAWAAFFGLTIVTDVVMWWVGRYHKRLARENLDRTGEVLREWERHDDEVGA